jgi:hypothetical protein
MDNYDEKLRELRLRELALEAEKSKIYAKFAEIEDERERLEKERLANMPNDLSEEEEKWLRDEITVVGKLLESKDVIFGGLTLLDEEPEEMKTRGYFGDEHSKKFSIDIQMSVCTEWKASLRCYVTIKTKNASVERIVREMVAQEDGYPDEEGDSYRRSWSIDWDYHQRIVIKNPYVHKDDE